MRKICTLVLVFILSALAAWAQIPLTSRNSWNGPYNIKMIAAPNLEPVYIDSVKAKLGILKADSVILDKSMRMTGRLMDINNCFKGGLPFRKIGLPKQSIICPDNGQP